jgi:hypothetical protein
VEATGWAMLADARPDHEAAMRMTRRAAGLAQTGTDLMAAATRWREDSLH